MKGETVLLVEDEGVIALDISLTLEENGYTVIGPFKDEQKALNEVAEGTPSIALLDINLGGSKDSFKIAHRLTELGVPIVFLTGYTASTVTIPEALGGVTRITKPVKDEEMLRVLSGALLG